MNLPPGFTSRPATLERPGRRRRARAGVGPRSTSESPRPHGRCSSSNGGRHAFDMERDTRVIHAADGALAAFAQHSTPDPELLRYEAFGPVDPAFEGRGLGSAIVDWTEAQTRSRIGPGLDGSAVALGAGRQRGRRSRCSRRTASQPSARSGRWRWIWTTRSTPARSPEGVTIRPFVMDVDGPAAQSVLNTAFRSHFGHVEETFEGWLAQQEADDTWDPTLGLLAEARRDDRRLQQQRGDRRGWLRVRARGAAGDAGREGSGGRCCGIRSRCWRRVGIRKGRLGVDTQNATGAVELYRSVGLTPVERASRGREAHRGRLGY